MFFYPEEDNVLGQYETSLNGTNTEEVRHITTGSREVVFVTKC